MADPQWFSELHHIYFCIFVACGLPTDWLRFCFLGSAVYHSGGRCSAPFPSSSPFPSGYHSCVALCFLLVLVTDPKSEVVASVMNPRRVFLPATAVSKDERV